MAWALRARQVVQVWGRGCPNWTQSRTKEETDAQRGKETCPRPQRSKRQSLFEPGPLDWG